MFFPSPGKTKTNPEYGPFVGIKNKHRILEFILTNNEMDNHVYI